MESATLRLYVTDASTDGGSLYLVSNDWDESTINWHTAPGIAGTALGSAGAVGMNAWIEFDVTSTITDNGLHSLALASLRSNSAKYSSREGAFPPEYSRLFEPGPAGRTPGLYFYEDISIIY